MPVLRQHVSNANVKGKRQKRRPGEPLKRRGSGMRKPRSISKRSQDYRRRWTRLLRK
jgi:hypothetical protein